MTGITGSGYTPVGGHWETASVQAGNPADVLTVAELNERARTVPGDEESDALLTSYIAAAISQVEHDTGFALPLQTINVTFDRAPAPGETLLLPCPPLQAIQAMSGFDAAGNPVPIDIDDPAQVRYIDYNAKPARVVMGASFNPGSRLGLWLTLQVGYEAETVPPLLKLAVGILAAHYLTAGRDRTLIGTSVVVMPAGYEDAINAYKLAVLV